jgi:hypothetical protein
MSRDIQCKWCYGWGHNRRTCPTAIEEAKVVEDLVEKYGLAIDDYDREWGYTSGILSRVRELAASEGFEEPGWRSYRAFGERMQRNFNKKKTAARGGRRCGFCSERGHNSRSCEEKKSHVSRCRALRALAHRVVRSQLESSGLVPGALIRWQEYDYSPDRKSAYVDKFGLVSAINWKNVAICDLDDRDGAATVIEGWYRSAALIEIRNSSGRVRTIGLPRNITQQTNYYYKGGETTADILVGPVKNSKIKVNSEYLGDEITLIDPQTDLVAYSDTVENKEWGEELAALLKEVGADQTAKSLNLEL